LPTSLPSLLASNAFNSFSRPAISRGVFPAIEARIALYPVGAAV
jgi:hypothetical protein